MVRKPDDVISIVEAAYSLDERQASTQAWLNRLLDVASPHLTDEAGTLVCLYDMKVSSDPWQVLSSIIMRGMEPRWVAEVLAYFKQAHTERARVLQGDSCVLRLSDLCGAPLREHPQFDGLARELGISDVVSVRAANPDGTGVFLSADLRRPQKHRAAFDARWSRISAHVAAAQRLRRAAEVVTTEDAEAILGSDGRVVSARAGAIPMRETLRRAALGIDRARGSLRRRDPDAALSAWSALVEGRWSLVDHFESDGKRFILAIPNAPDAPDPRGLTPDERALTEYVLMGHSNKLIAYELGYPEGTVARKVAAIARKLGVRSRVGIIDVHAALRVATIRGVELGGARLEVAEATPGAPLGADTLTAAERDVAALAARGESTEGIARRRRCSPRTVSNILVGVYRKLGIASRAELAASFGRRAS